ncbi:MAG: M20/M25/M40 family metallo-hydrolase [Acidobacteria bacterium]|nr:M20/M25/M40 family metallo-hydrolase [Acidobacteriota bacterium]
MIAPWLLLGILSSSSAFPSLPLQTATAPETEPLGWFQEYLRVDTTNPPGHEERATLFLARIFEKEGIRYRTFPSAPGRSNIYARIEGSGHRRPLILLNHLDVVPADVEFWTTEPFSGKIDRGFVYGRGALDMKSLAIAQLAAFVRLHRSRIKPARDLIFLGTADEEAGGLAGAGWFIRHHPDLIRGAEFLLTEGGSNLATDGRLQFVGIEVTQKVPCWLRIEATGQPGHGSVPRQDSAVNRLIRALERLRVYREPYRLVPAVERYFHALAPLESPDRAPILQRIEEAVKDPESVRKLSPQMQALLQNTISITGLRASDKINVIAPRAVAEVDCRLLPGEDPARFLSRLEKLIDDPGITLERVLAFSPAQSTDETELYERIRTVLRQLAPSAVLASSVSTGFTDSHYFRDLGIACYGFSPFAVDRDDQARVHGNDERISVKGFLDGVALYQEVILQAVR